MDFMKVLDQTVREIKREVNLKVLKVPEIEQKVLDATSSEPWGPHGSVLQEIAQATKKITDCQIIMNTLWTRLIETGSNWRLVYKALTVIEYLIANGADRAVDDILGHSFRISSISCFEYVEPNGKDVGINVRKKVETILALLNDKEKMQAVREKAAANRDKYFGLSSTGITYKSSSSSYGSSGFGDRYGGFGSTKENDSFRDNYKNSERRGEETDKKAEKKDEHMKSTGSFASGNEPNNSKRAVSKDRRAQNSTLSSTSGTSTKSVSIPSKSLNEQPNNSEDDFDDFDPRGSSTAGSNSTTNNQVDLFGDSLVGDLMDTPASIPTETNTINTAAASEVDLFADATFVSAPPIAEASRTSHTQGNVDLFSTQSAFPAAFTSDVDLLGGSRLSAPETKTPNLEPSSSNTFDPFAAIPLNNFEGSDVFGDFASHSGAVPTEPSSNSAKNTINILNQPSQTSLNNSVLDHNQNFLAASIPAPKKDAFQVKSGIWADSLSRGLIDLNITAPKKVSLEDIGIVGGLADGFFDDKEKGPPTSAYMGRAMGSGSGLGKSGFTSSTSMGGNVNFSSLSQQQFGNFK